MGYETASFVLEMGNIPNDLGFFWLFIIVAALWFPNPRVDPALTPEFSYPTITNRSTHELTGLPAAMFVLLYVFALWRGIEQSYNVYFFGDKLQIKRFSAVIDLPLQYIHEIGYPSFLGFSNRESAYIKFQWDSRGVQVITFMVSQTLAWTNPNWLEAIRAKAVKAHAEHFPELQPTKEIIEI